MRRGAALAAALAAAAAAGGCTSQWFKQFETSDLVTTKVLVRTKPEGAMVYLDGVQQARAPVRIPVEYDHVEQLWSRQSNTLLLFHHREDLRRHVYGGNRHVVSARLSGHEEAETSLDLQGEDEVSVELVLRPAGQ